MVTVLQESLQYYPSASCLERKICSIVCAPALAVGTAMVTKYQKRISGPLLDRIDIHIEVPRVDYEKLSGDRMGKPVKRFANEFKPRAIFNARDSQISNRQALFAMQICIWLRSGSFASCRMKVKA